MKFLIVLGLFVIVAAGLGKVQAQVEVGEAKPELKSVKLGKMEENAGKPRVYDPCNYNPFDHSGCTSACWTIGYYKGGFCSGYDCYCYI